MSDPTVNQQIEELKVNKFFITALENENLLNQLETALNTKDDAAILGLAREHGYNFILESLHLGLNNIANLVAPIALVEKE